MSVISLENRLRKIEAARAQPDHELRAMSDRELADHLREVSDDPLDHALADWFMAGDDAPLPDGAIDILKGIA